MDSKAKKAGLVNRLAPSVMVWVINRILTQPKVMDASARLGLRAKEQRKLATRAIRKSARNAASNAGWLTAGVAAVGVGVGLIARAASRR